VRGCYELWLKRCLGNFAPGVPKSRYTERSSATKWLWRSGATRHGRRSNRGRGAAAGNPLRRWVWFLSLAPCRAHLCAHGPDARLAGMWHPGPSIGRLRVWPEGKLYFHSQEHPINSDGVITVLEHLLREVSGRLVLICMGHRSTVATRSRNSWPMAPPNASTWNACRPMRRS
jgi:hypothetical protein